MRKLLFILVFLIKSSFVFSQKEKLIVDLAEFNGKSGTIEKPLHSKKIESIFITNKFSVLPYDVTINIEVAMLTPLSLPALSLTGAGTMSPCTNLSNLYNSALTLANTNETTANERDLQDALEKLLAEQKRTTCADSSLNKSILKLVGSTTQEIGISLNVLPNQNITVLIRRGANVYKMIFRSEETSRFVLSYGFGFTSKKLEPSRYFTEELGTDSFRISKKVKYDLLDLRFIPSIFFSYFIDRNLNKTLNHSITAGLGFSTQSPVVFIGYNVMWHQNIGMSVGLSFYEQQKLLGHYKEGQILKQTLEDNQLYETSLFRPNIFITINLRLANNPFKSTSTASNDNAGAQ